jgi:UMF1 family MFS transporter
MQSYTHENHKNRRSLASWCLYDWANSAFNTVIITFVFSVYFARGVVGDETLGSSYWTYALSFSGFAVALLSPVLGAVADNYGAVKKWLGIFTVLSVCACAILVMAQPGAGAAGIIAVLAILVIANTAFELAIVFYNSMLPSLAPQGMIGRISGWAWGLGYFGGLACLAATLFLLVGLGEVEPLLPVTEENSLNVRLSAVLVAVWFALFSLPLFIWTKDVPKTGLSIRESVRLGLLSLKKAILSLSKYRNIALFLVASAIYRDGLGTLFAVGGLFAAGIYGMDFQEILVFAIAMNVSAGLGALAFSFMDDRAGSKRTIVAALSGLIICGCVILLTHDKLLFMGLAVVLGLFVGPVQSASRALAGRLAPANMIAQTYGLYAFTGKSIAFLGPLAYGAATQIFSSQLAGMTSILVFWLCGMLLLLKVKE